MEQPATPNDFWRHPMLDGPDYYHVLQRIHAVLAPKSYLEIGTRDGGSLRQANCAAVAIDPRFDLRMEVIGNKPACHFYQQTSDSFFAARDPTAILGRPIDFAFLDGMHLYEFLLRDFMNVERHCRPNSVIALHDCMPTDSHIARRMQGDHSLAKHSEAPADWWAGDVWKTVAILQEFRPELRIVGYSAPPTGLVLVTGLNPQSTVLAEMYGEAVESMRNTGPADHNAYMARLEITAPGFFDRFEDVAGRYWL
ncbi:MAG: class I SAM-dependent methyltransferase [Alphaproteobacteria bacterium]|nr:class I SAM-dependent methyltransferase [Alphaproteobacteria bacterium]